LRINARAKIDSSRGKNIRGPAAIATQVHTDDGVVCPSVLSKSWDLKKAIFRDWDCQRRSCDDLALESCLVWLFSITDKKCGTRYRRDLHCSRTCDGRLVTDFREILRINARAKIDSSRGKNIRGPASITAQIDTDDAALGTTFLSKICDLKEAAFRDCDCER